MFKEKAKDLIKKTCSGCPVKVDIDSSGFSGFKAIGEVAFHIKGDLSKEGESGWFFEGEVKPVDEEFDFNIWKGPPDRFAANLLAAIYNAVTSAETFPMQFNGYENHDHRGLCP